MIKAKEFKREWKRSYRDHYNRTGTMTITAGYYTLGSNKTPHFSLTGWARDGYGRDDFGGSCHEEIVEAMPEFEKYVKWHCCHADGPTHYLANTMYHASDKDCHGLRKGEPRAFRNYLMVDQVCMPYKLPDKLYDLIQDVGLYHKSWWENAEIIEIHHEKDRDTYGSKFTINPEVSKWCQCEFDYLWMAEAFLEVMSTCNVSIEKKPFLFSEGKEPDLDAARRSAIWPDATLEQLRDKEALLERLPKLMEEFHRDMEELRLLELE